MTDPPDDGYVPHDEFVEAVRPFADVLRRLADAGLWSRTLTDDDSATLPAPDSIAMAELAQQDSLAGVWDATPIDTAWTQILLLLTAGEDAMKSLAALVTSTHIPVFAHAPLTRAGLEYFALAYWLGEPTIGARERIRRCLNERIQSAYEQSRLPPEANPEPGRQQRLLKAEALGFTRQVRRGQITVFAPGRPTITKRIQNLLEHERLGTMIYSHGSAISHGTLWGLIEQVERPTDFTPGSPPVTAPLRTSVTDIGTATVTLVTAHVNAYEAVTRYMGWTVDDWTKVRNEARRFIKQYLDVVDSLETSE